MPDVKLFVCGDVMTGRGIDQILPHPGDPALHEPWVRSALRYVDLAEAASGTVARPVDWNYVWGDALPALARQAPHARLVNLETAITACDDAWPGKGIHYRMHPANVECLSHLGIDCCTLANNHVLDWGYRGLSETLACLAVAGIKTAGAGDDLAHAAAPAVLPTPDATRCLVYAFGMASAGVPPDWAAQPSRSGVHYLSDLSQASVDAIAAPIARDRRHGDIVVASIHWGPNWGYRIAREQRAFAHALIEEAGVDLVHGHSSHHPIGIEMHRDRLVLYGCGDFLNDYEGIGGYDAYRPDIVAAYFPVVDASSGRLRRLEIEAFVVRRMRLGRASTADAQWLAATLDRESRPLGTRVSLSSGRIVAQPA